MAFSGALWVAACSAPPAAGPPEIAYGEVECGHCRMIVSEEKYAAAVEAVGGERAVFDDLGCLLNWVRDRDLETSTVWVHDVGDSSWLEAKRAVFARDPSRITPMGSGWTAREVGGAQDGAGPSYSWSELVESWEARSGDS